MSNCCPCCGAGCCRCGSQAPEETSVGALNFAAMQAIAQPVAAAPVLPTDFTYERYGAPTPPMSDDSRLWHSFTETLASNVIVPPGGLWVHSKPITANLHLTGIVAFNPDPDWREPGFIKQILVDNAPVASFDEPRFPISTDIFVRAGSTFSILVEALPLRDVWDGAKWVTPPKPKFGKRLTVIVSGRVRRS